MTEWVGESVKEIFLFGGKPPQKKNTSKEMYSLGVRDSIMIAHSFKGREFGPAQGVRFILLISFRYPLDEKNASKILYLSDIYLRHLFLFD